MDEIMQFFDFTRPCPEKIPDCEALRNKYTVELTEVKKQGGCGTCAERNFRQKYIMNLQNIIGQSNVSN